MNFPMSYITKEIKNPRIATRMARQAYDSRVKPNVLKDVRRAKSLFAPTQAIYETLSNTVTVYLKRRREEE